MFVQFVNADRTQCETDWFQYEECTVCTALSLPSLISVTPSCVGCDDSHYSMARSLALAWR